jgi:CheY-like chemotaxis protein
MTRAIFTLLMMQMIFLVDDDEDDIELMEEALRATRSNVFVITASNGMVLMDKLQGAKTLPSIILLDLNMPLKNGFQVLDELKENETWREIPVVVVTASSSRDDETLCKKKGCKLFLRKPTSLDEYNRIAKTVLSLAV